VARSVTLVFLIDALGWEIAEHFGFGVGSMPRRSSLGTVLGYSAAAIPSLLSGTRPDEHGSWAMFREAGAEASFGFLRTMPPLPHALEWRARRWVRRWMDRRDDVGAYYDLYEIPLHVLGRFDIAQKGNPFEPGGLSRETVFDWMEAAGVRYRLWDYRTDEAGNLAAAVDALGRDEHDVLFVYTAELDALMHRVGIFDSAVHARLGRYEAFLDAARRQAASHDVALSIVILSDHGMTDVTRTIDVWGALDASGLTLGRDYLVFLDSTMARFWGNGRAIEVAARTFSGAGRRLADEELAAMGCRFPGREYGDAVFLADPGVLIVPSFMGARAIAAMHGYHPDDRFSKGCFMTDVNAIDLPESILGFKRAFQTVVGESARA
jgi:Type I phosphodiesterase / nucleotide pyrophosphatase